MPAGLTATAAGSTQVDLAWAASSDNVGVVGYRVERCQGVGCSNFVQVAAPAGTGYSDTGLTPATSYTYRVRAVDAAGNLSGYSLVAGATTALPPDLAAAHGAKRVDGDGGRFGAGRSCVGGFD